jgi:8-oxo-dGTP pyrophosphatase MutT (NUDIX family)
MVRTAALTLLRTNRTSKITPLRRYRARRFDPTIMFSEAASQPLSFVFTHHPSAASFTASQQAYLKAHPSPDYGYIATGALVFDRSDQATPRILLLQRAPGDSMPGRWEIPGGGVDDEDESVLHAVARELLEEAGLKARHIGPTIGAPHLFSTKSGKKICKFIFLVQAEPDAEGQLRTSLDSQEHQRFVWASENEVRSGKANGIELPFTTEELRSLVLQAFDYLENDAHKTA